MRTYLAVQPEIGDTSNPEWVTAWLNGHAALDRRLVAVYHIPSTWRPIFIFEIERDVEEANEDDE